MDLFWLLVTLAVILLFLGFMSRPSAARHRGTQPSAKAGEGQSELKVAEEEVVALLETWLKEREPLYRQFTSNIDLYPPDWQWRRYFVLRWDHWTCRKCGACVETSRRVVLANGDDLTLMTSFNVHHRQRIGLGGSHALDNLELLCEGCHEAEHSAYLITVTHARIDELNQLILDGIKAGRIYPGRSGRWKADDVRTKAILNELEGERRKLGRLRKLPDSNSSHAL
jgi:hypothetical protein